jgi:hypothetical protein
MGNCLENWLIMMKHCYHKVALSELRKMKINDNDKMK